MGKGNKAPAPPDPAKTAAAATASNKATAVTQFGLGATNQNTPYGNLSYKQIGSWEDGTPRFEATTSLSPEEKRLYDLSTGLQGKFGEIGNTQADAVSSTLSTPFKLGNQETESRLMDLGRSQIDPIYADRRSGLETNLINSGIRRGTDAWTRAMRELGDEESRGYNDLLLSGRSQAANESLTERNQPLNEMIALLSNSQVQQPNFASTPQPGVAGVDVAGITQGNYNNQLAAWQQQQQNKMAGMGGLFKLGSALALGGWGGGGGTAFTGAGLY